MKKLLLFALAAGIGVSAYAQNRLEVVKKVITPHQYNQIDMNTRTSTPVQNKVKDVQVPNPKGTRIIDPVVIGQSGPYGVYSVLVPEQRCISYLPGLNTIAFTHRGEESVYPGTNNSTIVGSISTDNGANFNDHIVLAESGGARHRYPSGVLFNPAGNNDPSQAFLVAVGPSISAGGDTWDQNFFASANLDGSNNDLQQLPYEGAQNGSELIRTNLTITDNGDAFVVDSRYTKDDAGYPISDFDLVTFKGTKNGNAWTWNRTTERINFTLRDGTRLNYAFLQGAAFAKDGSIGYKWAVGQTAEYTTGFEPVLYYTEDGGATWQQVAVEFMNNEVMAQYLPGINGGLGAVLPWFEETAGVVDANGHLQMMAKVRAHASGNKDSLYYIYPAYKSMLFNLTFDKNNGVEQVVFIDSIIGKDVNKDECAQYCYAGTTGWDNRLQATVSEDGMYIAASWGDTPSAESDYEGFNGAPDIKGTGRHINIPIFFRYDNGNGDVPNFTADDIFTGTYRFSFAAETGKIINPPNMDGKALLTPISTSISLSEFEGGDEAATITHTLLNIDGLGGVPIPVTEGVTEMETAANAFTVSQNQPNPFTGTTTITVSSNTVAPVSVEVSNIMGQSIFTQNEGTVNGSKQITIDASNLQAGIYFYTVTVGSESQTKKMMVK